MILSKLIGFSESHYMLETLYCVFCILMVVFMIQTFQESKIAAGAGLALVDSVVISQPACPSLGNNHCVSGRGK